ncbi:class I SAM-dependent methyltransferase [Clostridium sp.]|uniref:class I SAM-dependent methyltransferase n=1 Tax=Clostridium sp. TaxID=1506 RepID=UPI002FDDA1A7
MNKNYFTNAVNIARDICMKKLKEGDIAVDATMGNGNDTVFLAELVGQSGKVYGFDIQEDAIKSTQKKIIDKNLFKYVKLINDGHENMDNYISEKVKLVIFNLGYLPKGKHYITTNADTTLIALKKALNLIDKNGVVILVVYYGHEQGKYEKISLEKYSRKLDQRKYNVVKMDFINQINSPPMLMVIEKRH